MDRPKKLLTIAICTSDRAEKLSSMLEAVIGQMIRRTFFPELLIIDSSRDKKTEKVINALQKKHRKRISIRFVHKVTHGISFARNLAVSLTKTKYLCFIDDDIIPQPSWLTEVQRFVTGNKKDDVAFGAIFPIAEDDAYAAELENFVTFSPWVFTANTENEKEPTPYTANVIIRTKAFQEIGEFNTVFANTNKRHYHPFGEDPEWFQRAHDHGLRFLFRPKMAVNHMTSVKRLNFFYLASRYYDDGKNGVLFQFYSKHYVHSSTSILRPEFHCLRGMIKPSKVGIFVRLVYLFSEFAGQCVMRFSILQNYEYYNSRRKVS